MASEKEKGRSVSFYLPAKEGQELWERLPNKGQWVIEKLQEDALQFENSIVKRLDDIEREKKELQERLERVRKNRLVMRSKMSEEQVTQRHDNIIRRLFAECYDGNAAAFTEISEKGLREGDVTQDEIDRVITDVQKKKERLQAAETTGAAGKLTKKEPVKEGVK